MRRFVIIATLCVGCLTAVNAQTPFTERIQKSTAGGARVTVTHDAAIDVLVNGPKTVAATPQQQPADSKVTPQSQVKDPLVARPQKEPEKEKQTPDSSNKNQQPATTIPQEGYDVDGNPIDTRKKVMRNSYKVTGYRVQAYAGGNSREDRIRAERTASTIKANYPNVPVYTHFYSPRWLCRVGNYRTYEEAHQMLQNVKKLGFKSATIVKGKISVQY